MKPHLEEAWRSLRLADRDLKAFEVWAAEEVRAAREREKSSGSDYH